MQLFVLILCLLCPSAVPFALPQRSPRRWAPAAYKTVWAASAQGVESAAAWSEAYFGMLEDEMPRWDVCGAAARYHFCDPDEVGVQLNTNCTGKLTLTDPSFSMGFKTHTVQALGWVGARAAASAHPTIEEVEALFDEQLGNMSQYSPWMDHHFAFYFEDIDKFVDDFERDGVPYLALSWTAATGEVYYSVLVHTPHTQTVYEIVSRSRPVRAAHVQSWPLERHFLSAAPRVKSNTVLPLHISRTARNISKVIEFYDGVFGLQPIAEGQFDGGRYVVFDHGMHIQYWQRNGQTAERTTAWLERKLEAVNQELLPSEAGCWPIWGDNHYTVGMPMTDDDYAELTARLKARGIGYRSFRDGGTGVNALFSMYVPLPGGWYVEIHPYDHVEMPDSTLRWDPTYCYTDCVDIDRDSADDETCPPESDPDVLD